MTLQQRDMLLETCWPKASLQDTQEPRRKAPRLDSEPIANSHHVEACQVPWNGLYLSEAHRFISDTSAQDMVRYLDSNIYEHAVPQGNRSREAVRSVSQVVAEIGVSNSIFKALDMVHAEMSDLTRRSGLFSLEFQRGVFYRHARDVDWLIWVAGNTVYRFPRKGDIGATNVDPALYWSSFTLMTARWLAYVSTRDLKSIVKQGTLCFHPITSFVGIFQDLTRLPRQTFESTVSFASPSLPC